ncbi:MAG: hypothetical protein E6L04_10875 [Thaumarchaeota archaeon]|nr:MAG: hypothetical protein E6L04_10875 [Nitrososphaerota archaeon]
MYRKIKIMKNVSMTIILISALAITLVSNAMFNGMPPAKAENSRNEQDHKGQVNTERQQINKCVKSTPYKDLECNNVLAYGVVCLPGSVCKLENYDAPFELITPN